MSTPPHGTVVAVATRAAACISKRSRWIFHLLLQRHATSFVFHSSPLSRSRHRCFPRLLPSYPSLSISLAVTSSGHALHARYHTPVFSRPLSLSLSLLLYLFVDSPAPFSIPLVCACDRLPSSLPILFPILSFSFPTLLSSPEPLHLSLLIYIIFPSSSPFPLPFSSPSHTLPRSIPFPSYFSLFPSTFSSLKFPLPPPLLFLPPHPLPHPF